MHLATHRRVSTALLVDEVQQLPVPGRILIGRSLPADQVFGPGLPVGALR